MSILHLNVAAKLTDFDVQISESIPLEGVTAVFGPSGAGKTTLLRIIAGFQRGAGHVALGDEIWEDRRRFVPPHRRQIASVFQQPGLFAHLDVAGNLAYAARRAGNRDAIAPITERFALGALMNRRTATLSGGEAQRVALARALLTRPKLILMDEPLSALDQKRREEIFPYIEELRDEAQIPILYVSHALTEVARLAGQVLVLSEGRVAGLGPTETMLADRSTTPALEGAEPGSLIVARIGGMTPDGLCELAFSGGTLLTPEPMGAPGTAVQLFIRARDVMIARDRPEGLSALNILPARVEAIRVNGTAAADVTLLCGGAALHARITTRSVAALGLCVGSQCHAIVKSVALARD